MTKSMIRNACHYRSALLAVSLAVSLSGCGGMANNRSLDSIHQPVVALTNYTLDVATGPGGLSYPEQRRLSGWFEAMDLRYGDRISIDDPLASAATRSSVEAAASRYGLLVGDEAPVTAGYVNAGTARIIVSRSKATVPGCPDWSDKTDTNFNNATSRGYGCSVNGNLAAMVADPEHLIKGASGPSDTIVMSGNKAIGSFRDAKPTGVDGLSATATSGN
jgi:pilus assembly protein CpaD